MFTLRDIDNLVQRSDWDGTPEQGYTGYREGLIESIATGHGAASSKDALAAADQLLLEHLNTSGTTPAQLFAWAVSENGQRYGRLAGAGDFISAAWFLPTA